MKCGKVNCIAHILHNLLDPQKFNIIIAGVLTTGICAHRLWEKAKPCFRCCFPFSTCQPTRGFLLAFRIPTTQFYFHIGTDCVLAYSLCSLACLEFTSSCFSLSLSFANLVRTTQTPQRVRVKFGFDFGDKLQIPEL